MIGIGVDPGEEGGIALVRLSGLSARLVCAERFYGHGLAPWLERVERAVERVERAVERVALRVPEPGAVTVLLEEVPTGFGTTATAAGLGIRHGAIFAVLRRGGFKVETVSWREWAKDCGVRAGKDSRSGGLHRLEEAGRLVEGAAARLDELEAERVVGVVDVAEAILIALAAARRGRG